MSKNEITLCLIVKNEEQFIDACLSSCHHICRNITVVDTGSTDRTIDIVKKYTDNVKYYPFDGDFSAARNKALENIETEWILFLDADEQFNAEEVEKMVQLLPLIDQRIWGLNILRYNFFSTGGWFTSRNLKLFRNNPAIHYQGTIGESVNNSIIEAGGAIESLPIILNHFGHCRSASQRDAKTIRYKEAMELEIHRNPGSAAKMYAIIALHLRSLGHFQEAWDSIQRALRLEPDSALVQICFGHVLRSTGKYKEASEAYQRAIQLQPTDSTAWNMLGVMELSLAHFESAQEAFAQALRVDPLAIHVFINQGLLAQAQNDYGTAVDLFQKAARRNSAFLHSMWMGYVEHDLFRELIYETIAKYAGLSYHLAYCLMQNKSSHFIP